MNITKKRYENFATGLCWAMLLFYVCVFFLLNFSITPQFYCTDMYEDIIVSIEMWKEKTLFPSNWVFGNQIYTIATPVWSALFYGLTGNAFFSMAAASSIMAVLVLISFDWMLRAVFPRLCDRLLGAVFLITAMGIFGDTTLTVNGWQLLFTMCTFYSCYAITSFLAFGCYLREGHVSWFTVVLTGLLCFFSGIQSLRQTAITIIPLLAMEFFSFLRRAYKKDRLLTKNLWMTVLFAAVNLLGVVSGKMIPLAQQHIYGDITLVSPLQYAGNFYDSLNFVASLVSIGRVKETVWGMIIFCVYAILGIACVIHYRKDKSVKLLYLLILSVGAVFGIGVVTTMAMRQIYYFMIYPLAACFVTLLFSKSHIRMRGVLLGVVAAAFILCCADRVAFAAVQVRDKDKDVSYRIYEDLKENDITTMYSVWNYCEKIAVAGNGEIAAGFWDVGNKPFDPKPYLHKTDTYSAPPETTAYIFCSQEEVTAAIEKAARAGTEMTLLLEYPEENIYIYKAPINLMEYYASISSDE